MSNIFVIVSSLKPQIYVFSTIEKFHVIQENARNVYFGEPIVVQIGRHDSSNKYIYNQQHKMTSQLTLTGNCVSRMVIQHKIYIQVTSSRLLGNR